MKALEMQNVDFSFDKDPVLENVNLSINLGEFIGIIGPNGGGKTTLLKLILGFLKPVKGKVQFFLPNKNMGYVPQINLTDKSFPITLFEVVLMGLIKSFGKYSRQDKEKVFHILEILELTEHKDKSFGELSGGLAQRTLFARALIRDPDIILLDEPTANIDQKAKLKIFEIIQRIKSKKTILMVTHDLNTIIENVERVLCVEKQVSPLLPKEVCEHFALGLYHSPLAKKKEE